MTPRAAAIKQAMIDGRNAYVGAVNPYAGEDYTLARAWRLGYRSMLESVVGAPLSCFSTPPDCCSRVVITGRRSAAAPRSERTFPRGPHCRLRHA
ncbi:hypothetical protein MU0083_002255 [[Mycobacterium] kokjensenii]|uniref:Uncharacterized protein n=1 Tax=[Mycobacterium] kokjensenii TaxID=3064287 RepID=A0ABM9LIR4_9MYCO|nr:hypothetical protein [Mycolicibacter sp. MU0083]CAJ1499731.1 hypothetical protein MU0083_002255 [Mycolicibacter sp. MU0083]